ncbi:hypothetical protein [Flavobacterium aestivum]|uniref:hypothetical protein n=1 Tax=Flavobacterium aestivum TaxID=3003257 RepID=UPI002482D2FA|nr:hypothetical protein [Flavobacterium aestivum]
MIKKIWRNYDTEELGEAWEIFSDFDITEKEEDTISKSGVHCIMKYEDCISLDYVITSLIPAARIGNTNKKEVLKNFFYIKLELMNGDDWFCFSNQRYEKEEALKFVSLFTGLNKNQAERVWKSKRLGEMNTYRLEK